MAKGKAGKKTERKTGKKLASTRQRRRGANKIIMALLAVVLVIAVAIVLLIINNGKEEKEMAWSGEDYIGLPKPLVTIEMENGALIQVELDPVNAPNTVRNFISLANAGFYDGLIFHRVIPGFMIQGGCPEGTGRGGPGYSIRGEFTANGHQNEILHQRGVISMARTLDPNSAGSQFFITVAERAHLDGEYAAFGHVVAGMEEVDRIAEVPRDQADKPLEAQRIRRISVETFGVEYAPPVKLK